MSDKEEKQKLSSSRNNPDKPIIDNDENNVSSESETLDDDINQATELVQQSAHFSGPIPSPNAMAKYEEVLPGSADRIMAMAEKEQNLREKSIMGAVWVEKVKTSGSVLVSVLLIAAGVYCAILGQPFLGGVFGTAGLIAAIFRRFLPSKETD